MTNYNIYINSLKYYFIYEYYLSSTIKTVDVKRCYILIDTLLFLTNLVKIIGFDKYDWCNKY